jgi:hypothetical protein
MAYFDNPLITEDQQAPSAMFNITNDVRIPNPLYPPERVYDDFAVTTVELFFDHPNLEYCTTHNVMVLSDSGSVEVTITFYAGDNVMDIEKLTDTGENFLAPGTTRIGYKTTSGAATARSWSR